VRSARYTPAPNTGTDRVSVFRWIGGMVIRRACDAQNRGDVRDPKCSGSSGSSLIQAPSDGRFSPESKADIHLDAELRFEAARD
jgi:hypothetical protein